MPDLKPIKIATLGVAKDFRESLIPAVIRGLGYAPVWSTPTNCDLLIYGPFFEGKKVRNWVPKPLRSLFKSETGNTQDQKVAKVNQPLSLLVTGENVRHDFQNCDFAISFDLGISNPNHFRMPYWLEMVDWSKEGVTGNQNPRFGRLLNLDRLCSPLGKDFLERPQKAAIFASHLREPRGTLLQAVKKQIEVVEFGRSFNPNIKNHSESGLIKFAELQKFAFNLCPENGMHPGYYTEKIPEAFMAGCLPITWADENVKIDFNPKAFINLAPMSGTNFVELADILHSKTKLAAYAEQALIINRPSLQALKRFLTNVIETALT
ncbi:MAG: glycosyltransferase family 10 domain-containing protein [Polynucleobacter sp.]|jgi:hypothetical protein